MACGIGFALTNEHDDQGKVESTPMERHFFFKGAHSMKVAQIWRYPVKSMAGERLEQARIGPLGIEETASCMWKTRTVV